MMNCGTKRTCPALALALLVGGAAYAQMSPDEAMRRLRRAEQRDHTAQNNANDAPNSAVAAPNTAQRIIPFDDLPGVTRRAFKREASNYLRVGDRIWSIQAWLRLERIPTASRARREPYLVKAAPLFYDPVSGRHVNNFSDIDPSIGDVSLVYGTVTNTNGEVAWINTVHGLVYVMGLDAMPERDAAQRVLLIVKPAGKAKLEHGDATRTAPAARVATDSPVSKVTPAALARYFQRHGIERFEQWRYRRVWDDKPQAKKVYQQASRTSGPGVAMGAAEPREVITDPGQYHYEWIRGGRPVPPFRESRESPTSPPEADANQPADPNAASEAESDSASGD